MEEPVRMVCSDCASVYRIGNPVSGKPYRCKRCGSGLRALDPGEEGFVVRPEAESGDDREADIARINLQASTAAQRTIPDRKISARHRAAPEKADPAGAVGDRRRVLELVEGLDRDLRMLEGRLAGGFSDLGQKADLLLERVERNSPAALAEQVKETGSLLLARLEEYREARKRELVDFVDRADSGGGQARTVEIDIDGLARRLAEGVRAAAPRLDAESGSVIDALARVADGLVQEQGANSARLDGLAGEIGGLAQEQITNSARLDVLAGEIKDAAAKFTGLAEWRGELSHQVADEIGRAVEDRVVGPISGALARQAPVILSELQDNKLADIVSRSVREAQRPLLREILAGWRIGVPVWLFASVLLPLLLILGYLLLPGEFGGDGGGVGLAAVSEGVSRLENGGVLLAAPDAERLRNIEDVILDLHGEALAHAKNAVALEEQIKNLNARLAEKEALVNEYRDTLQRQVRLLSAYRTRLTQLGVVPETIQE